MSKSSLLFLAIFWLILGVALIVWQGLDPSIRWLRFCGTDFSIGWAAVIISIYNFTRWWSIRSLESQRRTMEKAYERRLRAAEGRPRVEPPPDPNFDFTNPPPGSGSGPPPA